MILIPIEKYHHLMANSRSEGLLNTSKKTKKVFTKPVTKQKHDKPKPLPKISIPEVPPPKKRIKSDWIKL